jgi:probable HAF family extracellular repeat protein
VVVGLSFDLAAVPRAFVWRNGAMTDLNTLVPADSPLYPLWATSINSSGGIAGFGAANSGGLHALLATPATGAQDHSVAAAQQGARKPITLTEIVRGQLIERLGLRKRLIPGAGAGRAPSIPDIPDSGPAAAP